MSIVAKDSVKVIAESQGFVGLNDDVASTLAPDVEFHIREIVQEATKFMRHSKRALLTTEDINNALRLRNLELLYGFSSKESLQFVHASKDLYYIEDRELEFKEVLEASLPKCPRDTTLAAHWLAIEGVQPEIPQNPSQAQVEGLTYSKKKVKATGGKAMKIKPLVKHVLSKELQDYYELVTKIIRNSEDEALVDVTIRKLGNDPGLHQLLPYFVQFVSDQMSQSLNRLVILERLVRTINSLVDSPHYHIEPYLHQLMPPLLTCMLGKSLCENPNEDHWHLRDYAAQSVGKICKRYGNAYKDLQGRIAKTLLKTFLDPTKPFTSHYGAIVGITALGAHSVQLIILPHLSAYLKLLEPDLSGTSSNTIKQDQTRKCYGALLRAAGVYVHYVSQAILSGAMEEEGIKMDLESTNRIEDVKNLLPSVSTYYRELLDTFGESLVPYIANEPSKRGEAIV